MKRVSFLVVAGLVLTAGCQGSREPAANPFLGPTTIPPPPTGAISHGGTAPSYLGPPRIVAPQTLGTQTPGSQAPIWQAPNSQLPANPLPGPQPSISPTVPGTVNPGTVNPGMVNPGMGNTPYPSSSLQPYTPRRGGFGYRQKAENGPEVAVRSRPVTRVPPPSLTGNLSTSDSIAIAGDVDDRSPRPRDEQPATLKRSRKLSGVALASHQQVTRTLPPRPTHSPSPPEAEFSEPKAVSSPGEPGRFHPPAKAIDIMDLPEVGTSLRGIDDRSPAAASGFRLVSATDAAGRSTAGSSVVAADHSEPVVTKMKFSAASHGHAPDYSWIRGRLEYSQMERHWKLRYIPIDGESDEFGGSVVLADRALLSGHERGDFVEVRGKIGEPSAEANGFAPTYEATEVRKLK